MSEYLNSSPATLPTDSNPIENVDSPVWPASASNPTMRLESTPPESRQPTGTSATSRRLTARRNDARTASSQSRSDQSAVSARRVKSGSQYAVVVRRPSGSIAISDAGGTFDTPRRIVRGGGTTEWKD